MPASTERVYTYQAGVIPETTTNRTYPAQDGMVTSHTFTTLRDGRWQVLVARRPA